MNKILTADQFLTSILAMLKLSGKDSVQGGRSLDYRFEKAYETLLEHEEELKVTPNFTFFRDPLHGNSAKLRNALLVAKENGLLGQDTDQIYNYRLRMDKQRAGVLLTQSPLTKKFLTGLIRQHFPQQTTHASS